MKKATITFDDGYITDYTNTFKIFKRYGIKGTSFINTAMIGKEGFLNWKQIKEMSDYGWDFQCHTHNHSDLSKLDNDEIERELLAVNQAFKDNGLPEPEYFAYPYNIIPEDISSIRKHRKGARTGSKGGKDIYSLQSFAIHKIPSIHQLDTIGNNLSDRDVLVLHTHEVEDEPSQFGITEQVLEKTIRDLQQHNFEIITIKELFDGFKDRPKHKVIIMCAGNGLRWNNHLGVPKQMIELEGEPILHRTIRLLKERGQDDITITIPSRKYSKEHFGDLDKLGVKTRVGKKGGEMMRFLNVPKSDNALFLYGDVYYSERAIDIILSNEESPKVFGRTLGDKEKEIFAIKMSKEYMNIARKIKDKEFLGGAGWAVYIYSKTQEFPTHNRGEIVKELTQNDKGFIEINDKTDDFDKPSDYDRWMSEFINKEAKPRRQFYRRHISAYGLKQRRADNLN